MQQVTNATRKNMATAQNYMREYVDKRTNKREFEIGDLVKLRTGAKIPKYLWKYPCSGPYRVVEKFEHPQGVYRIQMKRGDLKTLNVNLLDKYYLPKDAVGNELPTQVIC